MFEFVFGLKGLGFLGGWLFEFEGLVLGDLFVGESAADLFLLDLDTLENILELLREREIHGFGS